MEQIRGRFIVLAGTAIVVVIIVGIIIFLFQLGSSFFDDAQEESSSTLGQYTKRQITASGTHFISYSFNPSWELGENMIRIPQNENHEEIKMIYSFSSFNSDVPGFTKQNIEDKELLFVNREDEIVENIWITHYIWPLESLDSNLEIVCSGSTDDAASIRLNCETLARSFMIE